MKRLLKLLIVICLSIGLVCSCSNTVIKESTEEESITEEQTNTYAWVMRWEHRYWYTNGDKSAPVVIEGYVKKWWRDNGLISITFVNDETYITGANNVLIKEVEG